MKRNLQKNGNSHNNNRGNRTNGSRFNRGGRTWNNGNRIQCQICGKFGYTASKCYFRFKGQQQRNGMNNYFQQSLNNQNFQFNGQNESHGPNCQM